MGIESHPYVVSPYKSLHGYHPDDGGAEVTDVEYLAKARIDPAVFLAIPTQHSQWERLQELVEHSFCSTT
jgi:hypothetical protein